MFVFYTIVLFVATILGGIMPLWKKNWEEQSIKSLLTFSASFLLGVTFIHLVPETIHHGVSQSGLLILIGFFLQLFVQKLTHGLEHGHVHHHDHNIPIYPLFIGLSIHAFSEGVPLGFLFDDTNAVPSLFLAIGIHKLPEAMLITVIIYLHSNSKLKAFLMLILFSLFTPLAAVLSHYLGEQYADINSLLHYITPLVTGAFIQIGTTILFESGTKSHQLKWKKWVIILLGILLSYLTMSNYEHAH